MRIRVTVDMISPGYIVLLVYKMCSLLHICLYAIRRFRCTFVFEILSYKSCGCVV